ncbi:MAG: ParB N-terminal domain-containing protein [Spirochaetia bacterium]|jgi:ParB family transcriptional regulator, chromosome partitioning protein|nr:ParB N-terminal domain-containing protein [Spirochaetia bacterium]MCF7942097.1 ParB N-terminal domain-containing protein [Spirochaetia bacterium]
MQLRVDEIKAKHRIRKDLGDLTQLMDSIKTHGLMNPIVVNERKELIAGERRLESVKRLGWTTIEVHVVHLSSDIAKIQMEIDENLYRRALSTSELADGFARIDRLKNPNLFTRIMTCLSHLISSIFHRR